MSLREVSLKSIAMKQFIYKLKGHSAFVYALIIAQLLGLLFSMGPRIGMSSGNNELRVSMNTYSTDTLLFFSFAWIIVIASQLTSKAFRNMERSLVTNSISSHLSNILVLVLCSLYAGVTSTLMSVVQRVIMVLASNPDQYILDGVALATRDLLLGIFVSSLYLILLAALTYFVRIIIEFNKAIAIIIPVLLIGLIRTYTSFFGEVVKFYIFESSLGVFAVKVLFTALILFVMSILLSNRREVR